MIIRADSCRIFVILLLVALLSGCASTGGYIKEQVLDVDTREPIPDAHVIISWSGLRYVVVDSKSDCFRVNTTQTDADGKFRFLPWVQADGVFPLMNVSESIFVYTPGYEEIYLPRDEQIIGINTLRRINPSSTDANKRLEYLLRMLGHVNCGDIVSEREKFIPFYKDLYQEALQSVQNMPYTPLQPDEYAHMFDPEKYQQSLQNRDREKAKKNLDWIKRALVRRWGEFETDDADEYFKEHIENHLQ